MKNLLVTLLSDQTIPNVQFLKYIMEKKCKDTQTNFLFVSTDAMESKGVGNWIRNVCKITEFQTIRVNHSDISDIEKKLAEFNYNEYEQIFVNVTGGTKMMSLTVSDFFKTKTNARIYYIDGKKCYLNFPMKDRFFADLADNISLKDYVESYGFTIHEGNLTGISYDDYTKEFISSFLEFSEREKQIIEEIRKNYRDKNLDIDKIEGLADFLCQIKFPISDTNKTKLNKKETKYLTGDWFEEWVYFKLIEEQILADENLKTGIHLKKNDVDNEFDIIFLHQGTLYTIECKTSISNGVMNILNETIYKSTALQKQLGLFTKSFIFTLSSKENKEVKGAHIDRSELMGVKVFCREDIFPSIKSLLNL
ncbi:hypothetical protein FACS189426_20600 [Bacteroidia bacterium]|nr:hypothetical protein FACS189426_20600 [Bacteroidia bacterium]